MFVFLNKSHHGGYESISPYKPVGTKIVHITSQLICMYMCKYYLYVPSLLIYVSTHVRTLMMMFPSIDYNERVILKSISYMHIRKI
jgi:hypothetical protein